MAGGVAICFVLAKPTERRPVESLSAEPFFSLERRTGYGAGLQACLKSLRRRHPNVPPVLLLSPDEPAPLADVDAIIPIDPAPYASIPFTGYYWGPEVYYKLDVFNVRGYDRVIYLDCDTLVLDDISSLWDMTMYTEKSFYSVRETADMGVHPAVVGKLNSGVMLINRPLLCESVFRRMVEIARRGEAYDGGDQGVINIYFDEEPGVSTGQLDPGYNVMVVVKKRGQWDKFKNRIRILHFTNPSKPWAEDHHLDVFFDSEFKRLWDDEYGLTNGVMPHGLRRGLS